MKRSRLVGAAILCLTATAALAPIAYFFGLSKGMDAEAHAPDPGASGELFNQSAIEPGSLKAGGFSVAPFRTHSGDGASLLAGVSGKTAKKIVHDNKAGKKIASHDGPLQEATVAAIANEAAAGDAGGSVFSANGEGAETASPGAYQLSEAGAGGGGASGGFGQPSGGFFSGVPAALVAGPPDAPAQIVTPLPGALPLLITGLFMFSFAARSRR